MVRLPVSRSSRYPGERLVRVFDVLHCDSGDICAPVVEQFFDALIFNGWEGVPGGEGGLAFPFPGCDPFVVLQAGEGDIRV